MTCVQYVLGRRRHNDNQNLKNKVFQVWMQYTFDDNKWFVDETKRKIWNNHVGFLSIILFIYACYKMTYVYSVIPLLLIYIYMYFSLLVIKYFLSSSFWFNIIIIIIITSSEQLVLALLYEDVLLEHEEDIAI